MCIQTKGECVTETEESARKTSLWEKCGHGLLLDLAAMQVAPSDLVDQRTLTGVAARSEFGGHLDVTLNLCADQTRLLNPAGNLQKPDDDRALHATDPSSDPARASAFQKWSAITRK
jgi:hypothetical protein